MYDSLLKIVDDCKTKGGEVLNKNVSLRADTMVSVQSISCLNKVLPLLPADIGNDALLISAPGGSRSRQIEGSAGDSGSTSSSECMGSPLKLESCVDYADVDRQISQSSSKVRVLHADRPHIQPLPHSLAMECLSAVRLGTANELNKPLICICNPATSSEHILAIGCYKREKTTTLMSLSYQEITEIEYRPLFGSLVKEYLEKSTISAADKHVQTQASAEYHLMSTCSSLLRENLSAEEVDAFSSHSKITIYVEWSNIDTLLMSPPPDSVATLKLNIVCGDKSSMVYSLHEELQYLKDLTSGLRSGQTNWPEVERSVKPLELMVKLLQSQVYDEEEMVQPAGETTIQVNSVDPRKNLDFTDRLWSLLMGCQSYSELLEVMEHVVSSVSNKRCRPLMVSSSNTNPLAKWIYAQQVGEVDHSSSTLDFGSLQALMYFIEIGLEKLTKDYIHTFLGNFCGLVTADKLDNFTKKNISISERLTNLSKLHTVLELSALLHSYIRLPLATVRSATASALRYLSCNPSLPEDGFTLTSTISSISDIVSSQSADIWEVKIGGSQSADNMFIRMNKSEPDHSVILATRGEIGEDAYYCSIVKQHTIEDCLE